MELIIGILYFLFALSFVSAILDKRSDVPIWLKLLLLAGSSIVCPIVLGGWLADKVLEG